MILLSIYSKVLVVLDECGSLSSKHNKLVKLYHSTEDTKLKELIRVYSEYLSEAARCQKSKLPANCQRVLRASASEREALREYCTELNLSKKPEWQILAERYDWRPKE